MKYRLVLPGLCFASFLVAQDPAIRAVSVTKTENVDFPAGGTLRIEKSIGELTIEGWDQPGVEITTTRSTKDLFPGGERDKELKSLDQVHVSTKVNGRDLVIDTGFPHRKEFPWFEFPWISPVSHTTNFDLQYRIKVPRNAMIVVNHDSGEVHLIDVTGSVQATDARGLITVALAGDTAPVVDARSRVGSVSSDFDTGKKGPWPFGHNIEAGGNRSAPPGRQTLKLRIGFGDIVVRKEYQPEPTPKSPGSSSEN